MHFRNKILIIVLIITAFFAALIWGMVSMFVETEVGLSKRLLFAAFVCGLCGIVGLIPVFSMMDRGTDHSDRLKAHRRARIRRLTKIDAGASWGRSTRKS